MRERRAYAVWIGAVLLTITALFHFTGYFEIPAARSDAGLPSFFDASLRPLWLFASLHWLLTAATCVLVTKAEPAIARSIQLSCAAVVILDAVLLDWFIGPFIGEALLAAVALLMMVGAYRPHTGVKAQGL
ncbi:MAG: hypothetical protein K2W86_14470 [Sphingomonas sp.]|uniref:hypothetical protein n=1 Tax=Sphingomonas sp. TaxID=28214 RepID=UPI0035A84B77|nr:hypothetical protein [Sphingomonas sp.]